jgi:hypothetical protein
MDKADLASHRIGSARASEVGSQGSADILDEDVERNERTRATGYLGKSSDIQWWRKAKQQSFGSKEELSEPPDSNQDRASLEAQGGVSDLRATNRRRSQVSTEPLSAASYHLDDLDIRTTSSVDAYEMPTSAVSHTLFEYYKSNVHTEFAFINVDWVADHVSDAILEPQRRADTLAGMRERAILNIIFAIGASYAHLIGDAQGDERDHLLYYTRARILGLEARSFVDHPDLQVVQLAALTGFYYLCSSQINRYVCCITFQRHLVEKL